MWVTEPVTFDTQENEAEGQAGGRIARRARQTPEYSTASIGVVCLFSDQVALVQELVYDRLDESDIVEHRDCRWSIRDRLSRQTRRDRHLVLVRPRRQCDASGGPIGPPK